MVPPNLEPILAFDESGDLWYKTTLGWVKATKTKVGWVTAVTAALSRPTTPSDIIATRLNGHKVLVF